MFKKLLFLFFVISCSFSLISCRKHTVKARVKSNHLKIDSLRFDIMTAKAKMTYFNGKEEISAHADIRIKKDSAIWILVSKLGVEAARVLARKDSIFIINRLEKQYLAFSYNELDKKINVDVSYEVLQSILLGEIPSGFKFKQKVMQDDDFFILRRNKGDFKMTFHVNRLYDKIQKVYIDEKKGKSNLFVQYDQFTDINTQTFPFVCKINLDYIKQEIAAYKLSFDMLYSKVIFDEKDVTFSFKIPQKYQRIE